MTKKPPQLKMPEQRRLHICDGCGKEFVWDENSLWFGSLATEGGFAMRYTPSPNWHPAARDAYDERIAILMEGPGEPTEGQRRIAWIQAELDDKVHKTLGPKFSLKEKFTELRNAVGS